MKTFFSLPVTLSLAALLPASVLPSPRLAASDAPASLADLAFAATYHTARVDGQDVFYREAGPKDAPVVLLLHGFPGWTSSLRTADVW